MTAPRPPRSQLAVLASSAARDEVSDRRWMRLWEHGVAEIEVERIECPALRESVIRECKRQCAPEGSAKASNLPARKESLENRPRVAERGKNVSASQKTALETKSRKTPANGGCFAKV